MLSLTDISGNPWILGDGNFKAPESFAYRLFCCTEGICSAESCCLKCCNIGGWWICGKPAMFGACELHEMCPWLNGWLSICDSPVVEVEESRAISPPGFVSPATRSNLSPLLETPGLEDWRLFASLSYPGCNCWAWTCWYGIISGIETGCGLICCWARACTPTVSSLPHPGHYRWNILSLRTRLLYQTWSS